MRHSVDLKSIGTPAQRLVGKLPVTVATNSRNSSNMTALLSSIKSGNLVCIMTPEIQKEGGFYLIQAQYGPFHFYNANLGNSFGETSQDPLTVCRELFSYYYFVTILWSFAMHPLVYFYLTVASIFKSICLIPIAVKVPKLLG